MQFYSYIPGENMKLIRVLRLCDDEHGAAAVEYALLVSFIAAVVFTGIALLGGTVLALFQKAADNFPG
jgi:Flp pilus assembly pilin Flp